jgi:hypothetical protein
MIGSFLLPSASPLDNGAGFSSGTTDASGESRTFIGVVYLEGGVSGGTKTISSSGGKVWWRTGGLITFANAGTNFRIGIQDVGATGLEDGTFDVYADLVGGTDTILANTTYGTAMETGSKTLTHGDTIAISFETTTRAGADSVQIVHNTTQGSMFPYGTGDSGAGPAKAALCPNAVIEFDDGTVGWIQGSMFLPITTTATFDSSSTPDERALIFTLPIKASITTVAARLASVAATDDFEYILYSDPLGTPVAVATVAIDADKIFPSGTSWVMGTFASASTLLPNVTYALAIRPTTTNPIDSAQWDLGAGNEKLLRPSALGQNWYLGTRSDQTGAFTPTTTILPQIGMFLTQLDDGLSPIGRAVVIQASGSQ